MVNPVIEPLDDEQVDINEGCLSVPNLRGDVMRAVNVRVRYLDRDGVEHDEIKRGLTAGTFQHECDHLDGMLFLDRVNDTRTLTTWEQFERFHRDAFVSPDHRVRPAGRFVTTQLLVRAGVARRRHRRPPACSIDVDGDRITAVATSVTAPPPTATRLAG